MKKISSKSGDLSLSLEAFCLDSGFFFKMRGEPIYKGTVFFKNNKIDAKFSRISYDGEIFWCDIVTGSLYNKKGNCMSSANLTLKSKPVKTKNVIKGNSFKNADYEF